MLISIFAVIFNTSHTTPKDYQVEIRDLQRKVQILEDLWLQEKNRKYLPGTNIEIVDSNFTV
jgi:hypothetical protein